MVWLKGGGGCYFLCYFLLFSAILGSSATPIDVSSISYYCVLSQGPSSVERKRWPTFSVFFFFFFGIFLHGAKNRLAKEVLSVVSQSPLLLKTATWRGQFFRANRDYAPRVERMEIHT